MPVECQLNARWMPVDCQVNATWMPGECPPCVRLYPITSFMLFDEERNVSSCIWTYYMFKHNHFNQNNDRGRHFELSYVFAMSKVHVHSYVSYSQSLESTKNVCLQYSLRYYSTFERVVNALGLFRSSWFISVLTFSLFGVRNHQRWRKAFFLCIMPFKNKTLLYSIVYIFLK